MIHRQTRMVLTMKQVIADLLAANAAEHPVQARRALEQAIAGALQWQEMQSYGPTPHIVSRYQERV